MSFILSFAPKHLQEIQNKVLSEVPKQQQHEYFIAYTLEHIFGKDWKYLIQTTNFLVGRNKEIQIDGEQFDNYEKYFEQCARYFSQGTIIDRCRTMITRTIVYAFIYMPIMPRPPHTWLRISEIECMMNNPNNHSHLFCGDVAKVDRKILKLGCSGMSKGIEDTTIATILKYVHTKDREEYLVLESWTQYLLHKKKMEMMHKKYFSENVIPQIRNEFIKKDLLKHYGAKTFESIANSDTLNYLQIMLSSS